MRAIVSRATRRASAVGARERGWQRRLAAVGISAVVSLGVAEAIVRLTPSAYSTGYRPAANPRLVYELEPGHVIPSLGARISSQGLRDRERRLEKPPGVYRIALVSDSTAFGWRVAPEESFPQVLERRLNEIRGGGFEVINFAVPGYNTSQEVEVVRDKVLPFDPDMVLLVFNGNDLHVCNYIQPDPTWLGAMVQRSYLAHLVVRWIDVRLAEPDRGNFRFPAWWLAFKRDGLGLAYPRQSFYPRPGLEQTTFAPDGNPPSRRPFVPARYHYMLGWDNYRVHLAAIRDLARDHGVVLVSTGGLPRRAIAIHRQLGIEHVVEGLWPSQLALEYGEPGPLVIEGDGHWNERGHALAAEHVLRYLVAQAIV